MKIELYYNLDNTNEGSLDDEPPDCEMFSYPAQVEVEGHGYGMEGRRQSHSHSIVYCHMLQ